MGVDFDEVRTAYEEELIEREVQEAEAIAEEEMEELAKEKDAQG